MPFTRNIFLIFNCYNSIFEKRKGNLIIYYLKKVGTFNEIKNKFFNYHNNILKIQTFFLSLKSIRQLQKELLTSMWISRIRSLYESGSKKTKKQLQMMKKIMNISEDDRKSKINEYYYSKIHEFCNKFKVWIKIYIVKNSNTLSSGFNNERKNFKKSIQEKSNDNILKSKPKFLFLPTPEKLNDLIFESTEKKHNQ